MKGEVEIAIRDLDQTVIGNPAHDLIRLGLSLATPARGSDLPGVTTAMAMEQMIDGYPHALSPIRVILKQAYRERQWYMAQTVHQLNEVPMSARWDRWHLSLRLIIRSLGATC